MEKQLHVDHPPKPAESPRVKEEPKGKKEIVFLYTKHRNNVLQG